MKKQILLFLAMIALPFSAMAASNCTGYNASNCSKQGGSAWVVGGTQAVASGGSLDVESGAALKLAGTSISSTAAELNYLDITTLGTGAASKAVVLDASGDYTYPATYTGVIPSSGTETFQSGSTLNVAGTLQIGGTTITPSAREINTLKVSTRNITLAVTTAITEAVHEGHSLILNGAGAERTFTLPAATGGGAVYKFIVGAANTSNYVIVRAGSDVMAGTMVGSTDNASDGVVAYETTNATTITLNGTTTGGVIGDFILLEDCVAATWCVTGHIAGSGTEVTPFS